MKYRTIYADPPWNESGGGKVKRGADRHYPLMKTADIIAMGEMVRGMVDDNAHLYLWVTNNFLPDGLRVMEAWGFRYITKITWLKEHAGLGQYFQGKTEDCLFGVRGRLPYREVNGMKARGVTAIYAKATTHSTKPDAMRQMIETVSYEPRLEMFARQRWPGWDVFGNHFGESNA